MTDRKYTDAELCAKFSKAERMEMALEYLKTRIACGTHFADACDIASDTYLVKYNDLRYEYDCEQAREAEDK